MAVAIADNMWGLLGLKLCLESAKSDDRTEVDAVSALYEERSSRADMKITATCFCAQIKALH